MNCYWWGRRACTLATIELLIGKRRTRDGERRRSNDKSLSLYPEYFPSIFFFVTESAIGLLPLLIPPPHATGLCPLLSLFSGLSLSSYLIHFIQHIWQTLSDILVLYKYPLFLLLSSLPILSPWLQPFPLLNPHTTFLHEDFSPLDEYAAERMSPCLPSFWLLFSWDSNPSFILA